MGQQLTVGIRALAHNGPVTGNSQMITANNGGTVNIKELNMSKPTLNRHRKPYS